MNDQPKEVQQNTECDPSDCYSHVQFVKEVLNKDQHDHSVSHQVEKMIFMKHNEQFNTQ